MTPTRDRYLPVPSQRALYLRRQSVIRRDGDSGDWYVIYWQDGQRVVVSQGVHSWHEALEAGLRWVGLA